MNARHCQIALLLILVSAAAQAEDAPPKNWLIAPITTEFQKSELSQDANVYCILNSGRILQNEQTNPAAFDAQAFLSELRPLGRGGGTIFVVFHAQLSDRIEVGKEALKEKVKQLCRDAGFEQVQTREIQTSADWKERMDQFNSSVADEDADEPIVMNDSVRAVAIRTPLSRYLTEGADCIVELRKPLDGRSLATAAAIHAQIAEPIERLKPSKKGYLQLRVSSTEAGRPLVDAFVESGPNGVSEATLLARSFGFESCRIRHTPTGGAPETLLDQPAPDFTLDALEGPPISFRERIKGQVALVTFWGVACGPCCQEAPHLTALFEKHRESGLVIVAVNAYDESREVVENFARKEKLTHPIALSGSKVSEESYHVGAFPTAFWIDHEGKVVEYLVGFDPGDETTLEATAQRLLSQRASTL